jgi:hypothetical protein
MQQTRKRFALLPAAAGAVGVVSAMHVASPGMSPPPITWTLPISWTPGG